MIDNLLNIFCDKSKIEELSLDQKRQVNFYLLTTITGTILLIIIVINSIAMNLASDIQTICYVLSILLLLISLYWFKTTNNIKISAFIATCAGLAQIIFNPYIQQWGVLEGAFFYNSALIFICGFLFGIRIAGYVYILFMSMSVVCFSVDYFGIYNFIRPSIEEQRLEFLIDFNISLLLSFFGLLFYENSRSRHVNEIEKLNNIELENRSKEVQLEAQEQISILIKQLAHEINNPLTISLAQIKQLKSRIQSEADLNILKKLENTQKRINLVANELQLLSSNENRLPMRVGNPKEDIVQIFEEFKSKHKNEKITISIHNIKNHHLVEYIPDSLSKIISALATNAIEKKSNQEVSLELYESQNHLIISITDYGTEIDEDILKNIFKILYTTKSSTKLRGLGLTKAKLLAKNMGTDIEVDTNPDRTIFLVRLHIINSSTQSDIN